MLVSDDGGPSAEIVEAKAIDALAIWFGAVMNPTATISTEPGDYRIGDARPVKVFAVERLPPDGDMLSAFLEARGVWMGGITELGNYNRCPAAYSVRGSNPWFVWIQFWWRGPKIQIHWPALDGLSWSEAGGTGLDVLLLVAGHDPKIANSDDATWFEKQAEDVMEVTEEIAEDAAELGRKAKSAIASRTAFFAIGAVGAAAAIGYFLLRGNRNGGAAA